MIRLHFVVEGLTEQIFVSNVLVEYLGQYDFSVDVRRVEFSRRHGQVVRGGLRDYQKLKRDLTLWMKEDANLDAHFTTMIDFYGLPTNFPGFQAAMSTQDPYRQIEILEQHFRDDIKDLRFTPYIQLHEFEALLFADISQLDWEFMEHQKPIDDLKEVLTHFHDNPEYIDNGPHTAPSKRIIEKIPEYKGRKSSVGPVVAQKIGLSVLRSRCLHFHQWLLQLEKLQ